MRSHHLLLNVLIPGLILGPVTDAVPREQVASPADWIAEGNQSFAGFGISVGTAGDVSDVIVGAPNWWPPPTTGGAAFAYFGSASGLHRSPDWMGLGQGTYVAAQYGVSAGAAGDVNGDGFDELLVGTQHETQGQFFEGLAYGYNGPEP